MVPLMSKSFSLVVGVAFALTLGACAKTGLSEEVPFTRDSGAPPGSDASVSCNDASDCADGLACNGQEACVSGACVPGAPPSCDDGIECTVDVCVEPGACSSMPDPSLCAGFETCDPGVGCVPIGCTDAGCDDGSFCNGQESCGPAGCAPGAPVVCDDGDPCTLDACDDGASGCVSAPLDVDMDGFQSVACGGGDCDDADPGRSPALSELCDGMVDEDCDLAVDCADSDCADAPACCAAATESCTNHADDDCDGAIDCADPDCSGHRTCSICLPIDLCLGSRDWDCNGLYGCEDPGCAIVCGGPIVLPL